MGKNIAIAASKGGTGKTTTAWNLSFGLSLAGAQVLLVDCDPQDNLRMIAGIESAPDNTLAAALDTGRAEPIKLRETVSLLPSGGFRLGDIVTAAANLRTITNRLKKAIGGHFDFVVMDCPPELGRTTSLALSLSDYVLIPCKCTWLSLQSIEQMIEFLDNHEKFQARGDGERTGVVLTFFTTARRGPAEVKQDAKKLFKNRLLRTVIRERVEIDYSQQKHKAIFESSKSSEAADDYSALVKEVLKRIG
ncbi:MAG TPA: ParA family protein [Blastocatellia bacterium]|nr:ParA family protein [Blastocatellia bacterium]